MSVCVCRPHSNWAVFAESTSVFKIMLTSSQKFKWMQETNILLVYRIPDTVQTNLKKQFRMMRVSQHFKIPD